MNLSKIAQENFDETPQEIDRTPWLRQRESELVKIIEALGRVGENEDWNILKQNVFDGVVESLERRQKDEANKAEINIKEMYGLQGQLAWARRYSDLGKLRDDFKKELVNVRGQLKSS